MVEQEKMWLARRGCGGPGYDEVGTTRFRGPEKAVVSEQLERLWLTRIDLVGQERLWLTMGGGGGFGG